MMKVLILGSGGREHALAWKIKQSPLCDEIFIAPGNAGTALEGENCPVDIKDFPAIEQLVKQKGIELVVIGPEEPLALGISDYFQSQPSLQNVALVGPDKASAQLESSKDFAKQFMTRYGIPTAKYRSFTVAELDSGLDYLKRQRFPVVLKADGLAAGKGVIICENLKDASNILKEMLVDSKFGQASSKVVVEEFLTGIELSVFILTDSHNYLLLPSAKDYKRIGDMDQGPNTGGMGAVSPVDFADDKFMEKVEERIITPTLSGMRAEGLKYRGFIFFGLINVEGEPIVIEYNVRMGDPETQAVLPRIQSDLMEPLLACASGDLAQSKLEFTSAAASTVVMVSEGYPGSYQKGHLIEGLSRSQSSGIVFHSGTKREARGVLTNGGRVLALTGLGEDMEAALASSYHLAENISWPGAYYRKDIGRDLAINTNNSL